VEKQVIPQAKMVEGIRMILNNVSRYISDTRLLLSDKSVEHAALLAMFAAEELGKASLLCETLKKGEPAVDLGLFRGKDAHERKMDEARRLLGDNALLQSSRFGFARFPFILGAPDVEASSDLRMDCTFVDFKEGEWTFGALFAEEHLDPLLNVLQNQCSSILTLVDKLDETRAL
jgi:AbiV family abortive infection protein